MKIGRSPHNSVKVLPATPTTTSFPSNIRVVRHGSAGEVNAAFNTLPPPSPGLIFARRKRNLFKGPMLSVAGLGPGFGTARGSRGAGEASSRRSSGQGGGAGRRSGEIIEEEDEDEEAEEEDDIEEVDEFSPIGGHAGEEIEEFPAEEGADADEITERV